MTTPALLTAAARSRRPRLRTPAEAGLPDPRPITGYTASYDEPGGRSRITIALEQPCIIRSPAWSFIDCADGSRIQANEAIAVGNSVIQFQFDKLIPTTVAFVEAPYQDMEVQNFQGGF